MRLHDPLRPKTDGCLLYVHEGQAAGAKYGLPVLNVDVSTRDGAWLVTIHMPTSGNAFGTFSSRFNSTTELADMLRRYEADPERVIAEDFKYDFSSKVLQTRRRDASAGRAIASSLADLGLGD